MGESGRDPRRLYSKNVEYLVFMLTPLFAILATAVPLLSELWLGYFQTQFVVMAVCLSAAWYLNSVTAPAYFAYLGDGKLRWLTVSHVIMGASNLVIGMILGPVFGWPGVLAAFVLSLALGSAMPVWTYHREHAIELSAALSGSNVVLLIICVGVTGLSLLGYWAALRLDSALWVRGGLVIAATVAMLLTAWRHPLQPAVFQLVRGAHTTTGL
jgi:O-antigen/teichoic acid export membrane protein